MIHINIIIIIIIIITISCSSSGSSAKLNQIYVHTYIIQSKMRTVFKLNYY